MSNMIGGLVKVSDAMRENVVDNNIGFEMEHPNNDHEIIFLCEWVFFKTNTILMLCWVHKESVKTVYTYYLYDVIIPNWWPKMSAHNASVALFTFWWCLVRYIE